ncbi:DUF4350 domain-containing protein [Georgenia subflava]|uniref:DUF4350 domain-containing protein n=1 Tax=Georgenia subflava TaxID=1622177 RepID=A0A6N7ELR4_9MICO|nr:DUF4350 domain-containing protein [Georgenia subflava]MPV37787.1 DUF4350 domain-containing protein [Georgenia subflava]
MRAPETAAAPTADAPTTNDTSASGAGAGPDDATGSPTAGPSLWRRSARWWRRRRTVVVVVVAFVALAVLAVVLGSRTSSRPLAPDNPDAGGARAAAQILSRQGVAVHEASRLAQVGELAGPGTTVLVTDISILSTEQRAELVGTGADLVIAGSPFASLDGLGVPFSPGGAGSAEPVHAQCPDPDAGAAARISFSSGSVTAEQGSGAVVCFPVGDDGAGAYAVWTDGTQTVRYLADPRLMTNEHLAEDGNAALTLRMLGHHEDLVWYLPSVLDTSSSVDDGVPTVPAQVQMVLWMLLGAAAVLALGQARSLGRVVTEVMPVVVRSAETTRGRGRLYRRSGAHDHAAAALRAGGAARIARALGLPRSAEAPAVTDAVARATGWDPREVADLLYGPPPTDDGGLLALSTMLDALESEVHRT